METYRASKNGQSTEHRDQEEQCDDHWRAGRIGLEDVVNFWKLAIADCLLSGGRRSVGVSLDSEVECLGLVGCGTAEGRKDEVCDERLGGVEELRGKVFLSLPYRDC